LDRDADTYWYTYSDSYHDACDDAYVNGDTLLGGG
jgi:hypothetical protein